MNNIFETKDLNVAAFLFASGEVRFEGLEEKPGRIFYFQFSPNDKTEELVSAYWDDSAKPMSPKKLFSARRDLYDMMMGEVKRYEKNRNQET